MSGAGGDELITCDPLDMFINWLCCMSREFNVPVRGEAPTDIVRELVDLCMPQAVFSMTCHMWSLYYQHDICLSVCLSVMLVDCDHLVQQKVEIGIWQYNSVSCYLQVKADQDCRILWSRCGIMWSFALRQHPAAHMLHYLSMCWASRPNIANMLWNELQLKILRHAHCGRLLEAIIIFAFQFRWALKKPDVFHSFVSAPGNKNQHWVRKPNFVWSLILIVPRTKQCKFLYYTKMHSHPFFS